MSSRNSYVAQRTFAGTNPGNGVLQVQDHGVRAALMDGVQSLAVRRADEEKRSSSAHETTLPDDRAGADA